MVNIVFNKGHIIMKNKREQFIKNILVSFYLQDRSPFVIDSHFGANGKL